MDTGFILRTVTLSVIWERHNSLLLLCLSRRQVRVTTSSRNRTCGKREKKNPLVAPFECLLQTWTWQTHVDETRSERLMPHLCHSRLNCITVNNQHFGKALHPENRAEFAKHHYERLHGSFQQPPKQFLRWNLDSSCAGQCQRGVFLCLIIQNRGSQTVFASGQCQKIYKEPSIWKLVLLLAHI